MSNNPPTVPGALNISVANFTANLTAANETELKETVNILSFNSFVFLSVFNSLFAAAGTFGNVVVLVVIFKNSCLQTVPDLYVGSLATADLVVSFIQQPMFGYRVYHADRPNELYNSILQGIGYLALLASVSSIFIVTIDRFVAIRYPFLYLRIATKNKARRVIALLWGLCIAISSIDRFINGTMKYLFVWGYVSLLLLMNIIMYLYLFIEANRQQNKIISEGTPGDITTQENIPQENRGVPIQIRQKRDRKAARTIAIVMVVFLAFWCPFLGFTISNVSTAHTPEFMRVFYWVWAVSLWNSAINPYIYCARNTRYRSAFARLIGLKNRVELEPSQQASFRRSQHQSAADQPSTLYRGVGSVNICW